MYEEFSNTVKEFLINIKLKYVIFMKLPNYQISWPKRMLNRNDAKKTTTVLSLPLSAGSGDNLHPQILKRRDQKKNECLGGVKESLLYVSCQKRLCKLEYDFEG